MSALRVEFGLRGYSNQARSWSPYTILHRFGPTVDYKRKNCRVIFRYSRRFSRMMPCAFSPRFLYTPVTSNPDLRFSTSMSRYLFLV